MPRPSARPLVRHIRESETSTDTGSLFQRIQELGRQQELGNPLRGFTSKKVWLGVLIWLLIVNLILFFTTTGLRQVAKAPAAAGEPPPGAVTVMLYGFFVGMLVTFGARIVARGATAGEKRAGTAVPRTTTVRMQDKLEAGREAMDPGIEVLLLARFLLAQASLERATRLLQGPPEAAETGEPLERAIEILNLQAAARPFCCSCHTSHEVRQANPVTSTFGG